MSWVDSLLYTSHVQLSHFPTTDTSTDGCCFVSGFDPEVLGVSERVDLHSAYSLIGKVL